MRAVRSAADDTRGTPARNPDEVNALQKLGCEPRPVVRREPESRIGCVVSCPISPHAARLLNACDQTQKTCTRMHACVHAWAKGELWRRLIPELSFSFTNFTVLGEVRREERKPVQVCETCRCVQKRTAGFAGSTIRGTPLVWHADV